MTSLFVKYVTTSVMFVQLYTCFDSARNETESSIAFVLENTDHDVLTNITVSLNVIAADLIQL